jgi:DNA-binding MurR/RpiR family transcriptional regulator
MSQKQELQVADSDLRQQMELEIHNLHRTFERLDTAYMESVAGKLVKARRIWLLGFRHSHYLAGYARWQMLQIRDGVFLLNANGATLADQVADIQPDDIVIAIGFRRRMKTFLNAMKALHARKLRILYLTDPNVGASINYATWVLTADVSGAGTFDSYPAAVSLIHMLSSSMFKQSGRAGRERFKQIEDLHDDLDDF